MELTEQSSEKASMPVKQRVKKYRDKRKNDSIYKEQESRRIERIRKLKVSCMSETELSSYRVAVRERKRKSRKIKKGKTGQKSTTYRTHFVKKTVKNTYKTLPRSPAERAEVLSKLAEQALLKLQEQARAKDRNFLRTKIKAE